MSLVERGLMPIKRERIPYIDDPLAAGRRLAGAREDAGLSQRALAFAGCSAAYISRIERGERVPSLQVLRELAHRCGVSEEYLAWGRANRVDPAVAARFREVEEAELSASRRACVAAYRSLARAANRAARALTT